MARFDWHMEEFRRIRTSEGMAGWLKAKGEEWAARCNAELHAAQEKRGQPVEDGYDATVTRGGTRARLYVSTYTARAAAHEARNHTLLKQLRFGEIAHESDIQDLDVPEELGRRSRGKRKN